MWAHPPERALQPRQHRLAYIRHVCRRLAAHRCRPTRARADGFAGPRARVAPGRAARHAPVAQGRLRRVRRPARPFGERIDAGAVIAALREPEGPRHPRGHPHRERRRLPAPADSL